MSYEFLRQFADSWGLLYLLGVFCVVVVLIFLPGASRRARDAASIPFKEDR